LRFGCAVHAYVLMTNPVQLTPKREDNAGDETLRQRYVQ
jgi:putative transposase